MSTDSSSLLLRTAALGLAMSQVVACSTPRSDVYEVRRYSSSHTHGDPPVHVTVVTGRNESDTQEPASISPAGANQSQLIIERIKGGQLTAGETITLYEKEQRVVIIERWLREHHCAAQERVRLETYVREITAQIAREKHHHHVMKPTIVHVKPEQPPSAGAVAHPHPPITKEKHDPQQRKDPTGSQTTKAQPPAISRPEVSPAVAPVVVMEIKGQETPVMEVGQKPKDREPGSTVHQQPAIREHRRDASEAAPVQPVIKEPESPVTEAEKKSKDKEDGVTEQLQPEADPAGSNSEIHKSKREK